VNKVDVEKIVESEIDAIEDPKIKKRIQQDRVEPKKKTLQWPYGNEKFLCWEICRFTKKDREGVGVVFCEEGALLKGRFLLIFWNGSEIGMDSSWFLLSPSRKINQLRSRISGC